MVAVVRKGSQFVSVSDEDTWLENLPADFSEKDIQTVTKALHFAIKKYPSDATTLVGEPIISHLLTSSLIIADVNLLADAVAATLLSESPVHVQNWQDILQEEFGTSITELVIGIDQIERLTEFASVEKLATPEEKQQQAETMRKMLLAMVSDIRVVLIKLAIRTRTMHFLSNSKNLDLNRKVAKETMDIFAPLANRLGVWQIKWELEDLCFRHIQPEAYSKIAKLLDEKRIERIEYIDNFVKSLQTELSNNNIHCEVAGRPKHIYSIYKKMVKKKLDFSGLYDIRAVRILVNSIPECYTTLGIIHNLWQPIPGEFDDYIAQPKANDYQSLHTVVIGPDNKGVEIQIRTFDMHEFAEFGVAAHWRYKEGGNGGGIYEQKIAWLRQLLDWRETLADSGKEDLATAFQTELFNDTIYVLTPQGKVLSLPYGATPIDFAYAVHSGLGDRCRGAKVNGQIVPLSTPLENGQRVEILTAKQGGPSLNWVLDGWVKSNKAISKIRAYIRQQNADSTKETGKAIFDKQVAKSNSKPNLQHLAETLGFDKLDDLYLALGQGDIGPQSINRAISKQMSPEITPLTEEKIVKQSKAKTYKNAVLIDGEDGLLTILAKCCKPAPPDHIIGFVTKGRGISIHRNNCPAFEYLAEEHPEKVVAAGWAEKTDGSIFPIDIEVRARDRNGLLRDVSDLLTRNKLNVIAVQTLSKDLIASMRFTVEVNQVLDLPRVLSALSDIKGVIAVNRL